MSRCFFLEFYGGRGFSIGHSIVRVRCKISFFVRRTFFSCAKTWFLIWDIWKIRYAFFEVHRSRFFSDVHNFRNFAHDIACGNLSSLKGNVSSARGNAISPKGNVSSLQGNVSSAKGNAISPKGNVSSLKGNVSSAKGNVSSARGNAISPEGNVSSLIRNVSSARGNTISPKGNVSSLKGNMSSHMHASGSLPGPEPTVVASALVFLQKLLILGTPKKANVSNPFFQFSEFRDFSRL